MLEKHHFVTVGMNGRKGETVRLERLLRDGAVATATTAMPAGPATLTVSVTLDPGLTTELMLQDIRFAFRITVSDQVVVLPAGPGTPGGSGGNGAGGSGSGAGGSSSGGTISPADGLAATGITMGELPLVLAAVALGSGGALLLRMRRAARIPQNGRSRA